MYTYTLTIYMYINNVGYFSNLRIQKESENISDCDLEVYINHLDKLREDFKIRFVDYNNMHVPEWLLTPFDMKIDNNEQISVAIIRCNALAITASSRKYVQELVERH